MARPNENDCAAYYGKYVSLVKGDDATAAIFNQYSEIEIFLKSILADKWDFAYAEEKWTVKELVQHIIDAERIFTYRALRIARKDETPIPGFDENTYAPASEAGRRTPEELIEEMLVVRKATILLFKSFTDTMLSNRGTASNQPVTVNALGFITAGHFQHHKNILEERYL